MRDVLATLSLALEGGYPVPDHRTRLRTDRPERGMGSLNLMGTVWFRCIVRSIVLGCFVSYEFLSGKK